VRLCLKYDFSYPGNSGVRPISVASGIRDENSEPFKYFDPRCSKYYLIELGRRIYRKDRVNDIFGGIIAKHDFNWV
jgi:hypothetical protein